MKMDKIIFVIFILLITSYSGCLDNNQTKDKDNDGVDNNADFYDDGNGAITVAITKYIGDGYTEEDGTDLDIFFYISLSIWVPEYPEGHWELLGNISNMEFSRVFENTSSLEGMLPYMNTFDIDDDIEKISASIYSFDYEGGEKSFYNSRIDLEGDDEDKDNCREDIILKSPSLKSTYYFEDDGKLDFLDEPDAYIEWSVSIVGID